MGGTAKRARAKATAKREVSGGRKPARRAPPAGRGAPPRPRVFGMSFASVYPLYVQKAERKGRTREEVDEVVAWLTGYRGARLRRAIVDGVGLETFFARAPRMNPDAGLIQGVVCGVRVEEVADPLMRKIRQLDKLVDELAQGRAMAAILRR